MDREKLKAVLEAHAKWLRGDATGSRADLSRADLSRADLWGADLWGANLRRADLSSADLRGANLRRADLSSADLRRADLSSADLRGADLSSADLPGANLRGADLSSADLSGAKVPRFQIPQEGELIVFKKLQGGVVAKLRIPPEARRTASIVGRKCRAEFVEVLEGTGTSLHDGRTMYAPGETVRPDKFDDDVRVECTSGIHFFLTREEAEAY